MCSVVIENQWIGCESLEAISRLCMLDLPQKTITSSRLPTLFRP